MDRNSDEDGRTAPRARWKQWLHFLTGDRKREAAALRAALLGRADPPADPATDVTVDAERAVGLAHGETGTAGADHVERPSDRRARDHKEMAADLADENDLRALGAELRDA